MRNLIVGADIIQAGGLRPGGEAPQFIRAVFQGLEQEQREGGTTSWGDSELRRIPLRRFTEFGGEGQRAAEWLRDSETPLEDGTCHVGFCLVVVDREDGRPGGVPAARGGGG